MTEWLLSRIGAVAIILSLPVLIANCSRVSHAALNAPAYLASYQRHADIRYGEPGERQSLDVYVPPGASKRPVVVFWYGGTWSRGAKEWYRFVGASLASSGYVAVLPDYRLYPKVRFPTFIEDGAQALKWVHAHVGEFGGDPDAIFLMGHSAGASRRHSRAGSSLSAQSRRRPIVGAWLDRHLRPLCDRPRRHLVPDLEDPLSGALHLPRTGRSSRLRSRTLAADAALARFRRHLSRGGRRPGCKPAQIRQLHRVSRLRASGTHGDGGGVFLPFRWEATSLR